MHLLFRLCIWIFAPTWIVYAFRLPSRRLVPISASQCKTVLHAVSPAVEPGKLLYEAAVDGDLTKMKIAIKECNANTDQLNYSNAQRYGRTPLVIACYYNNVEAVKLLLSTPGVDVNKGIDFGTPIVTLHIYLVIYIFQNLINNRYDGADVCCPSRTC